VASVHGIYATVVPLSIVATVAAALAALCSSRTREGPFLGRLGEGAPAGLTRRMCTRTNGWGDGARFTLPLRSSASELTLDDSARPFH
jgi:hypothetical protein